jgi:thiol:disulfide interchange protein DsbD
LGLVVTFSGVGVAAALSGGLFGAALTRPAVLIGIAALMVALALSCFGAYQLKVPDALAARVGRAGGGAVGALLMGMTMGLVAAPCVGPIVVGLLLFVAARADALLGFWLFFLLSLGLGLPYLVLALAAGSIARLPRSGAWLQWTEHLFGWILLAMAVYFVSPLLPDSVTGLLAPAFAAVAVVSLGFLDPAGREFRAFLFTRRVAGVVGLALIGAAYLPAGETETSLPFVPFSVETHENAKQRGAPYVIEFRADWCLPCKEMEERTFTDPSVVATGKGMSFLTVDMTTTDERVEAILEGFGVIGAPTTIFFGSDGDERTRRVGFIGPEDFAELLRSSRDRMPDEQASQGRPGA